jgi:Tfp pilus assembly protein PilN
MINLLPPEIKTGYSYGRKNVVLRKWIAIFLIALVGLAVIGTYGLLAIKQSSLSYDKKIAVATNQLKKDNYEATQKQVKEVSGNFQLVVKVLGQEVLFSKLLQQMGKIIPPNASLTSLNIIQVSGGIDITAAAIDYNTASQVQVNLADPDNKIFSKADIVGITCNGTSTNTANTYPCSVSIRALFANDNPYLFINSKGTKK